MSVSLTSSQPCALLVADRESRTWRLGDARELLVAGKSTPGRDAFVCGGLLADHLQYLAAMKLAQPPANHRRHVAATGLTQIHRHVRRHRRHLVIVRHYVHLLP